LERSQEMMNHIIRHLSALMKSIPASGAEMHAKPNARVHVFQCRLRETVIRTKYTAWCADSRDCEAEIIGLEKSGHHFGRRGANGRVLRNIIGMNPNVIQRRPGRISDCISIAIGGSGLDGFAW